MSISDRRRRFLRASAAACLLALPLRSTARDAADRVTVIDLQNRRAEAVVHDLRELFPGATLQPDGFRLLVRAPAHEIEEIRQMVAELDRASPDLILRVRRRRDHDDETAGRIRRFTTRRDEDREQFLRLRDGGRAVLMVGETLPAGYRLFAGRAGVAIDPIYRDTARGFAVEPRMQPDGRVRVAITHLHQTPLQRGAEHERVATEITLEPGSWHDFAGIRSRLESDARDVHPPVRRRTTRARDDVSLEIRVDPAEDATAPGLR
ncbi:secretin N-terminal domain-containing protein [Thioalkalivibrio sp. ALE20]|uniref:secretin N-terminal domain-containing protein n=1 Tax=Thioalkalivibrio sp. ALE20 TaxID=545275 RepID=UPI000570E2B9|nr:secretin N-terminal domain-containing protein [Thioalkalivibrio sp. ALE20]